MNITNHDVLGLSATENVQEITGVIDSITYSMSGSIQYGINPKSTKRNPNPTPFSHDFDNVTVHQASEKKTKIKRYTSYTTV